MTTVACWVAVDQKPGNVGAQSAMYVASDSRLSTPSESWDLGVKVLCSNEYPDIYAYCGNALFALAVMIQFIQKLDCGGECMHGSSAHERAVVLSQRLSEAARTYRFSEADATILLASREGKSNDSRMRCYSITSKDGGSVVEHADHSASQASSLVAVLGSGREAFLKSRKNWDDSLGPTSRGFFSALVDSIRSTDDPRSGGPPQLAALYRNGKGRHIGVIIDGKRFLCGSESTIQGTRLEWRDQLFQICDEATMARRREAQRQPRPKLPR
jgi:hypothetical protein